VTILADGASSNGEAVSCLKKRVARRQKRMNLNAQQHDSLREIDASRRTFERSIRGVFLVLSAH
jgi:hypothetical protein